MKINFNNESLFIPQNIMSSTGSFMFLEWYNLTQIVLLRLDRSPTSDVKLNQFGMKQSFEASTIMMTSIRSDPNLEPQVVAAHINFTFHKTFPPENWICVSKLNISIKVHANCPIQLENDGRNWKCDNKNIFVCPFWMWSILSNRNRWLQRHSLHVAYKVWVSVYSSK